VGKVVGGPNVTAALASIVTDTICKETADPT
jgi:hypothetical protein